jgi:L-2-hydroxyglutarate oxidase LhgO
VGSSTRLDKVCAAVRTYLPSVETDKFYPDYAGIRPKLSRMGETARDFEIRHEEARGLPGVVNLLGIESPGLTSSLAIAEHVSALLGYK